MRNLIDVIDEMLKVIPESEEALRNELEYHKDSQAYRAPEDMIQWKLTHASLANAIFPVKEDWQWEVWSVWSTKSIEELKAIEV